MAYIGQGIKQGTFKVLDTSGNTYNGSNTTFNLGTQVGSAAQLLVSHDGVIQLPGTDYTLATGGTQITFSTAPASGASIFITEISGAVGGTVTPSDTSVTADKLNTALLTGQTDIGGAIADADLFLIDDGAGGTLRKTAASRIKTYIGAGDNTPSFGATASSTQSISNGGFVKVTLDTESWDTDSAFDNSTNYRFTVPSGEGGKYVFHYGGYLVSMTTNGYFQIQLYKNGASLRSSGFRSYMSATATSSVVINASHTADLSAGDYIEFYVIQDNSDGGGGSRTLSDSNYKPYLTGFKLLGV